VHNAVRGEFLYFRCGAHAVPGAFSEGTVAVYDCGVKGCERLARAYWYRGEQFAKLPVVALITASFDEWLPP